MSKTKSSSKNQIPQWQSEKMKALIAQRWYEVWHIVETRQHDRNR